MNGVNLTHGEPPSLMYKVYLRLTNLASTSFTHLAISSSFLVLVIAATAEKRVTALVNTKSSLSKDSSIMAPIGVDQRIYWPSLLAG